MFAVRLKELREESKLSQKEFSSIIGVAQSTYALYETARREPSMETLCKISRYFKVSTDYLLGNDMPRLNDYKNAISKYGSARGALNSAIARILEAGVSIKQQDYVIKALLVLDDIFSNLSAAHAITGEEAKIFIKNNNIPMIREISFDAIDDPSTLSEIEHRNPSDTEYRLSCMSYCIDKASDSSNTLNKLIDSLVRDYKYKTALKQLLVREATAEHKRQKEEASHDDSEIEDA